MRTGFHWLECPRCRGPLTLRRANEEDGLLDCDCSRYPVIADIPILSSAYDTRELVRCIEDDRLDEALGRALRLAPRGGAWTRLARLAARLAGARFVAFREGRRVRRIAECARERRTFRSLLSYLFLESGWSNPETFHYFYLRRSDPTFLAARAALAPLVEARGPVLDLACGVGHLSAELIARLGTERVVSVDAMFSLLYLARRFIVPDARLVCASADTSLPLRDAAFDGVLCCDAFFDVREQAGCAREMMRVSRPQGVIVLPHLHNAEAEHGYRGVQPLGPDVYLRLFSAWGARLYDEVDLLEWAVEGRGVDLTEDLDPGALARAKDMVLVASRDARVFRAHRPIPLARPQHPRFAPLLAGTVSKDWVALEPRFPTRAYREEFPAYERTLPRELRLPADALARCQRGDEESAAWLRRGIVVDLPPQYD